MDSKPNADFRLGRRLLLTFVGMALLLLVLVSGRVSGSASLPNGLTATINGPFFCSEQPAKTRVEAGGHVFDFSSTMIAIDGSAFRPLDRTVTDIQIDSGFWSTALRINGSEVVRLR